MSNSIWHNKNEKPMMHTDIILCGDGWSMPIGIVPETVNTICWENVEKWCYLDELITQADKAERAIWWLKEIVKNHRYTPITTAEMALKELDDEQ